MPRCRYCSNPADAVVSGIGNVCDACYVEMVIDDDHYR